MVKQFSIYRIGCFACVCACVGHPSAVGRHVSIAMASRPHSCARAPALRLPAPGEGPRLRNPTLHALTANHIDTYYCAGLAYDKGYMIGIAMNDVRDRNSGTFKTFQIIFTLYYYY